MKQVTIFGLGLIGASMGLALRQLKPAPRVIGNEIQFDAARQASSLKAVDKVERDPVAAVAGSDIVIVATPVGAIPDVLRTIAGALDDGCLVTDTGSTKREVMRAAREILPANVGFVGGHPMTGRATGGVDGPSATLFQDAVYCLSPAPSAPAATVARAIDLVEKIGARRYFVDPAEHDGLVAGVSHLPYVMAATLMRMMAAEASWREMSMLAAGGFDSATRLAGADPRMYSDILATNSDNLVRHLDRLMAELAAIRARLAAGDTTLLRDLEQIQKHRLEWEAARRRMANSE